MEIVFNFLSPIKEKQRFFIFIVLLLLTRMGFGQVSEVKSISQENIIALESVKDSSNEKEHNISQLIYGSVSSSIVKSGEYSSIDKDSRRIYCTSENLNTLSNVVIKSEAELIFLQVNSTKDFTQLDLSKLSHFHNLKYIFISFSEYPCNQTNDSTCIIKYLSNKVISSSDLPIQIIYTVVQSN
jgi:hypothetical protein